MLLNDPAERFGRTLYLITQTIIPVDRHGANDFKNRPTRAWYPRGEENSLADTKSMDHKLSP
jgi:hypothetical protein